MKPFCTISTLSHLHQCFALADSIAKWNGFLYVLLIENKPNNISIVPKNVQIINLEELNSQLAKRIIKKYSRKKNKLRWSLKSVFLIYLLKRFNSILYVDNDILFFNDFRFLFDKLEKYDILLTPHFYPYDTFKNQNWLEANFRVGLYNAGFIGANNSAIKTLTWWANACLYRCEKNYMRGLFDDQKYLDLFPIIHKNTHILTHKGCNVAEWNKSIYVRYHKQNTHFINDSIPLIFYHFNTYSLKLLKANDPILLEYLSFIKKYKPDTSSYFINENLSLLEYLKLSIWKFLNILNNT